MAERSKDWYKQAERDLKSAGAQLKAEFFEWACFIAQQAAEKAVKAVYQKLAAEAWGHSVNDLLKGLKEKLDVPDGLFQSAIGLDKFYIPARYPNGWAAGFPAEYITRKDAENAISDSKKILRFCKDILAK
ncbi:MAG: HEPN domain-containing protein [Candidatus Omnitrophota bacterium]